MIYCDFSIGCRTTGQLAKVLQATLLPFEEEVFINYLKDCNESQTSDILIMYYLQQARLVFKTFVLLNIYIICSLYYYCNFLKNIYKYRL